jgi:hypothetical protein
VIVASLRLLSLISQGSLVSTPMKRLFQAFGQLNSPVCRNRALTFKLTAVEPPVGPTQVLCSGSDGTPGTALCQGLTLRTPS